MGPMNNLEERVRILLPPGKGLVLSADDVTSLCEEFNLTQRQLCESLIPTSFQYVHAPISHFSAGAVLLGNSGRVYLGFNVEFPGMELNNSIHAEQCAVMNALLHDEPSLQLLTTSPVPCGHCRQFLRECRGADTLEVQCISKSDQSIVLHKPLLEVLPSSFGPDDLDCSVSALDRNSMNFSIAKPEEGLVKLNLTESMLNKISQMGLGLLSKAHAPHTKSWASVVLGQRCDGETKLHGGVCVENAAYNPTLSPVQAAISSLLACKGSLEQIQFVVLFEQEQPNVSYHQNAQALLTNIQSRRTNSDDPIL